jgi:hypothetical protein
MEHPPASTRVLALMPMLRGYEAVRATVAATVAECQLHLVWLENLLEDWEWLEWLYASISQCDVVVANPSQHNAFVMYEVGVARKNGRPMIVMLDRDDSQLSGSLDGSPFLLYSNGRLDDFAVRLRADLSLLAQASICDTVASSNPGSYYREAVRLLKRFTHETGRRVKELDEGAFNKRLSHSVGHGTFFPALVGTPLGEAALLAALIRSSRMVDTMDAIRGWIEVRADS